MNFFQEDVLDTQGVIKQKRDKFLVEIRKQKREQIFKQKRLSHLRQSAIISEYGEVQLSNKQIYKFPEQPFRIIRDRVSNQVILLDAMCELKLFMQILSNKQNVQDRMCDILTIVPFLFDLLQDVKSIQNGSELPLKAQEILIDISFFCEGEQIKQMVELPNFANIYNTLSCSHHSLQSDCIRFLHNVVSEFSDQEKQWFLAKSNICELVRNTYLTWGCSEQFTCKAFKLIQFLLGREKSLDEDEAKENIELIEQVLTNSKPSYKLDLFSFRLLDLMIYQIPNKDSLVNLQFSTIIINYLCCFDDDELRVKPLLETLKILSDLTESKLWIKLLVDDGLIRGLTNILSSSFSLEKRILYRIIYISINLFDELGKETYELMDYQQDYVELLLTVLRDCVIRGRDLPDCTVQLLISLVDRPRYIDTVVTQIQFFKIMCNEMERFEVKPNSYFELEDWLRAIFKVLNHGNEMTFQSFSGELRKHKGDFILEYLQKEQDGNIMKLSAQIMDLLE